MQFNFAVTCGIKFVASDLWDHTDNEYVLSDLFAWVDLDITKRQNGDQCQDELQLLSKWEIWHVTAKRCRSHARYAS